MVLTARWAGLIFLLLALGLCSRPASSPTPGPTAFQQSETPTASRTPQPTQTPTPTDTPTATSSVTATWTPTSNLTPTSAQTPSRTPTPTATPELRGHVLEQSNCRYGPGAAYLYEWGLYPDNVVTVLGRNLDGSWVYVHPWYFVWNCWVNTSLLKLNGDVFSVQQITTLLPYSQLYKPPMGAHANRSGSEVTISWNEVYMTEDDNRGYLIEAWLCQSGQQVFTAVNPWVPVAVLHDEAGCSQPSSARLYTAEKHGYTQWVAVPWPPAATETPTPARQ
jgi:hypothetical protein